MKVSIFLITLFTLSHSSISSAKPCGFNVHLRVDESFSKNEKIMIHRAAIRWYVASSRTICFKIRHEQIAPNEKDTYRTDFYSTVYNVTEEWQRIVATTAQDCQGNNSCAAVAILGKGIFPTSDIFVTKKYNFLNILTHELGHVLGLGHSLNKKDIMFPWVKEGVGNIMSANDNKTLDCLIKTDKVLFWNTRCLMDQ